MASGITRATGLRLAVAMAVAATLACGCQKQAVGAQSTQTADAPVVFAQSNDAEVNAAIAEARGNLPRLWQLFESRPSDIDMYSLKIAFPTSGGGAEHIWIEVVSRDGDNIVGTIDNDPEYRPDLKLGMTVHVKASQISDWSYRRGGKLFGHFTTRVLVRRMQPAEAADTLKLLSPTPLEPVNS
jgi:uncharacterized protein YegJ (DUF2314 family)